MHSTPTVIAEAGSNHNGDVTRAIELVDVAVRARADAVKFQFINPQGLYLPAYSTGRGLVTNPVFEQRRREVLSESEWERVFRHARDQGISCSASVFDVQGLSLLERLQPEFVKVASTDLNNYPFLARVARTGLPTILSTGMSELSEVDRAVGVFAREGALDRLTLLHCVSVYPCPVEASRLWMIRVLREAFGLPVGYSDHTLGSAAACAAVALGATVLEKHYTIDKALPGFDHLHALEPAELADFVTYSREVGQSILRQAESKVSQAEQATRLRARRSLYASRDLEPGAVVTEADVLIVRPSGPLVPADLPALLGGTVGPQGIRQFEAFSFGRVVVPSGENSWERADDHWRKEMHAKGMTP